MRGRRPPRKSFSGKLWEITIRAKQYLWLDLFHTSLQNLPLARDDPSLKESTEKISTKTMAISAPILATKICQLHQ